MVDPETVALIAPAVLVHKLLGPTADYIGEGIKEWTERRVENVQRVFRIAERNLGPDELERPGTVPPRVLKAVLEEGQFAEDEIAAEYLGGVLAAARTETGRDDRAASMAALIGRLSTYQLRTHYLIYSNAWPAFVGTALNLGESSVRQTQGRFYMSADEYQRALALDATERPAFSAITTHSILGLAREGLLGDWYSMGEPDTVRRLAGARQFEGHGVLVELSVLGVDLFVGAHGLRGGYNEYVYDHNRPRFDEPVIDRMPGFTPVRDIPLLPTSSG